jgi:4,5-dihydroxyphthalate decarboxylase
MGAREPVSLAVAAWELNAPILHQLDDKRTFDLQLIREDQSPADRAGTDLYERFLKGLQWDGCELSLAAFLVGVDQGAALQAIPVFTRRRFSLSQMYRHRPSIAAPGDLTGKRIGLTTYQTTLSVLGKGDLARIYGVPWQSITWVTSRAEPYPLDLPEGVEVEQSTAAKVTEDLAAGRIQAYIGPRNPLASMEGNPDVVPLFEDPRTEEERYLREQGFAPIMHVLAFQKSALQRHPDLPAVLRRAYGDVRRATQNQTEDPDRSLLFWGGGELQRQEALVGSDPWADGREANRTMLERFAGYCREQGLTHRLLKVDELFTPD